MFTVIGLSHAENVANPATRGVTDDNHAALEHAVADDASLTVVLALIFYFDRHAIKDYRGVLEVKAAVREGPKPFGWIEADAHLDSVYTKTEPDNLRTNEPGTSGIFDVFHFFPQLLSVPIRVIS